jgi:hypothetical protein
VQPLLQWKAMTIAQRVGVFVALGIKQALRMRHIAPLYNIFPHYLINGFIKTVIQHKMCVSSYSTTFL